MIVPYHPTSERRTDFRFVLKVLIEFYSILQLCGSACTACM